MTATVEMVVGYDHGGRPHEVILVDGRETDVAYYEIDPDTRLRDGGHIQGWLQHHEQRATHASPQAALWIRRWVKQTAQQGGITPDMFQE